MNFTPPTPTPQIPAAFQTAKSLSLFYFFIYLDIGYLQTPCRALHIYRMWFYQVSWIYNLVEDKGSMSFFWGIRQYSCQLIISLMLPSNNWLIAMRQTSKNHKIWQKKKQFLKWAYSRYVILHFDIWILFFHIIRLLTEVLMSVGTPDL